MQHDTAIERTRSELVVLGPADRAARCRVLGTDRDVTLRAVDVWDLVPGEIVTVRVGKEWTFGRHRYLSGEVERRRLDVPALDLVPLRLLDEDLWHPEDHYWGEDDEPLKEWEARIIAGGARPSFEMERVLPGADPHAWDTDPIVEAGELHAAGCGREARRLLAGLLVRDLRCLDAHAHLGNFELHWDAGRALRHYEVGVRIGELSLGADFDGLLPWGRVDNRPFLRALHGFGLCLWRLGRFDRAAAVFERMLWLNPTDNQGVRFLLADVRAGEPWEECVDGPDRGGIA